MDKNVEDQVVNAACEQQRGDPAAQSEAADQRMMRPAVKRHMANHALATRGASAGTRQSQVKARFVSKDQFAAINARHSLPQCWTLLFVSLRRRQRLFFSR